MNCFSYAARCLQSSGRGCSAAVKVQLDFRVLLAAVHFYDTSFQAFERLLVYNNAFILIKMNHSSPDFRDKVIWHNKVPNVTLNYRMSS